MKKIKLIQSVFVLFATVFLSACSNSPQPIEYGKDACHFCQMTIVDKIHGAEIVTDKGKIFKFDAAECLIRHKNELTSTEGFQFLTNHFESPEKLIPLEGATFLISENLPSPMGAYLTAFKTKVAAEGVKNEKKGKLYNWTELNEHLKQ